MRFLVFIHVVSAVIFIGNIVTVAFWKLKAEFSRDPAHIHRTAKNIMVADYIFTIPSNIGLLISGFLLAFQSSYPLTEINWLTLSLTLFIVTGILWVVCLLPLQRKMIHYSQGNWDEANYKKVSRTWDALGTLATLIPLFILYLMVMKPF